jgi:hypothetical protein
MKDLQGEEEDEAMVNIAWEQFMYLVAKILERYQVKIQVAPSCMDGPCRDGKLFLAQKSSLQANREVRHPRSPYVKVCFNAIVYYTLYRVRKCVS